ncbi:MAG TPA: class I SAM-dependent methyltransferase [Stellaceae bacterium]|nr:class I SAM-dependent methyltransferase [Stellaceae bacterium]
MLRVESVLDVGCGRGAWLSEWSRQDVSVTGVDGSYVDRKSLLIPESRFIAADLSRPIDLGRKFDLVQSLEVAEHLPEAAADTFVDTLARHGPTILFSAAVPGQGGEHHVNEQPYDYWRDKFRRRGYLAFDALRPMLTGDHRVEPWYRYNVLLFIAESETGRLSPSLASARLPDGAAIPDVSPLSFRLRKSIFRRLPPPWVSQLAVVKHKITNRARSRAAS